LTALFRKDLLHDSAICLLTKHLCTLLYIMTSKPGSRECMYLIFYLFVTDRRFSDGGTKIFHCRSLQRLRNSFSNFECYFQLV